MSGLKLLTILFLLCLAAFSQVQAANWRVTRTDDRNLTLAGCPASPTSDCSLREAVTAANANAGADTITIDDNLFITLNLGELVIGATLTIEVSGARVERSATVQRSATASQFRIFSVNADSLLTINNLIVTGGLVSGGSSGGGIFVSGGTPAGNLTLNNCTVRNNQGGGIRNNGTLRLNNSSVNLNTSGGGNGGGITNFGSLTLDNSFVSGNTAGDNGGGIYNQAGTLIVNGGGVSNNQANSGGGGIFNLGFATITNASIIGNRAFGQFGGGGIVNRQTLFLERSAVSGNSAIISPGGGILNFSGFNQSLASIANSTISDNTACSSGDCFFGSGGGISNDGANLVLNNTTVSNNRGIVGGVEKSDLNSPVSLRNTIIAGNLVPDGSPTGNTDVTGVNYVSGGNNLIGNVGNATGFGASDIVGTNAAPLDARLRPLGSYGGATQTQPPFSDSPAVDAGNNCVLIANGCGDGNPATPIDQRGRTRSGASANSRVDIGAVELTNGKVVNGNNSGAGSLRDAAADNSLDLILFEPNSGDLVNLTAEIIVNRPLDIRGNGALATRISGQNLTRVFRIAPGGDVFLSNLQVSQGSAATDGGGILNDGNLRLRNCIVSGGRALNGSGGGLYNSPSGIADIRGCSFLSNQAQTAGGAIANDRNLAVGNSTFALNTAANGAAINSSAGVVTSTNNTVAGNIATASGGGIRFSSQSVGAVFNLQNTISADNTAPLAPDADGVFVSQGNNLIGKADGASGFTASDITGTIAAPVNPHLQPISNYGGNTFTRPPLPASRAINAGGASNLTRDQRGISRNIGGATDIGAAEFNLTPVGALENDRRRLPNAAPDQFFSQTVEAFGTGAFTFSATNLPAFLTLAPSPAPLATAVLSGTPTATQFGTYNFSITAVSADNFTVTNNYTLVVQTPTAASVSIGGRVFDANGRGVRGALVIVTDAGGAERKSLTNSSGFYRFEGVVTGATYIFTVRHKLFQFAPQTLTVTEDLTDYNFTALPPSGFAF